MDLPKHSKLGRVVCLNKKDNERNLNSTKKIRELQRELFSPRRVIDWTSNHWKQLK